LVAVAERPGKPRLLVQQAGLVVDQQLQQTLLELPVKETMVGRGLSQARKVAVVVGALQQ
jgi:hypothetical protein